MPIFVSRFSPERSLIGSFVAPGSRQNETPERAATVTPASAASSGNTPQGADRSDVTQAVRTQEPTQQVSTEQSTRSASVQVSDPSAEVTAESTSPSVGSLTLLDQLRLRRNGAIPSQNNPADQQNTAVENPVDTQAPAASAGVENRLGPLAERLRALTAELSESRSQASAAPTQPEPAVVDELVAENQTANNAAVEESLDSLISALQDEGTVTEPVTTPDPQPALNVEAIAATIAETEPVSRDEQTQTLREGLQTIATGLRADAAIESRQNVEASARNAEAASSVRGRREVQQNQREIQSLQGDRRAAQQELRSADQQIRQLQNRNTQIQSDSAQQNNPGTSLDILAQ